MSVPTFQRVSPAQLGELLEAVRHYYAEDGLVFDQNIVRPALDRLLKDRTLGEAYFLANDNGVRTGYIVYTYGFDHEVGGLLATVTDLFVEPSHRRQGLARAALNFVARNCHGLGVCQLELQVERHNAAGQALYRRCGFRTQDRIPMFLPLG